MTECFTKKEICDILNSLNRYDEVSRSYSTYVAEVAYGNYFDVDQVDEAFGLETNCTEIFVPKKETDSWG